MRFTLTRVEDYRPVPGKPDQLKLYGTNHYVRIRAAEGGPLYIQNGRVWTEGGQEVKREELPEWFWSEVKKVNPEHLAEVRFTLPGQERPDESKPEAKPVVTNLRRCEECGAEVEPKKWGVHVANHRKRIRVA